MRRWVCPRCNAGVHAPDKPRRDDVRRYCLDCSRATGRLVERTCPALDRVRTKRAATAKAKRTRNQERAAAATIDRRSVAGVDMLVEARRLWRLPAMVELRSLPSEGRRRKRPAAMPLPTLEFRHKSARASYLTHSSGTCWPLEQRITITFGIDPAEAIETVLHELVHAAAPYSWWHCQRYRTWLMAIAREAWPTVDFRFHEVNDGDPMRDLDRRIAAGIRAELFPDWV